jgi:hypothetical protein
MRALGLVCAAALQGCSGCGSNGDDPAANDRDGAVDADGGEQSFGNGHGDGGPGGGPGADGGDDAGGGSDPLPSVPGVQSLRIEPASVVVVDDGVAPGETAQFMAIGTFEDGERDVTELVAWSLADEQLGEVDAGLFTSAGFGGETTVRARAVGVDASAELRVRLELDVRSDGAPDGIEALFETDLSDDDVVDDDGLRIVYPSHETMFPRNLERVDHQWRADAALDRFEVRFESDVALLRFYTADTHLLPDLQAWQWLANTHAGRSLQMTVRGASSTSSSAVVRSQPITLYYSRAEVLGALYYWSTGSAGVLKATISSPVATKFFTDPDSGDDTCVSCHTVSRNGRKLSAGYGGEKLRAITVPERELLIPSDADTMGAEYGWGTFSPDASRLLYASKGLLTLLDADTGAELPAVALPDAARATHPDWAPNGDYVALAYANSGARMDNKDAQGTSIARLPVGDDDTFGEPEILRASEGADDTLYFPSYSPDSHWIAFVRGTGKSKDNVTSKLYLLPADGGDPIDLTRLNERVRHEDGVTDIGNSMPTWAPSTRPDVFFMAFSSLRAYGDVLPAGRDQLWAVAIDPAAIERGEDPSYAAFWLPFQDPEEGNHRAFWAIDTDTGCPSDIEICDDLDNDCDGVVDEDCCTPGEEVCDGEDNNCDGTADEGCCVPSEEVCDGVDNDCDLVEDEGCGCDADETCGNGDDDDCDGLIDERCNCGDAEVCGNGEDDNCNDFVDEGCVD